MNRIEIGAQLLDVKPDTLNEFESEDSFNPGNKITGVICRQSDHRYGALVIMEVNGFPVMPQVIFCTPKLHYPFGKSEETGDRSYHWPREIKQVVVYDKLDGTNICAYSYADQDGKRYLTFKTRLTPVVQESRFGSFDAMWREVLDLNPGLLDALQGVLGGKVTINFEMYGYRNPHLILYPVALDAKMLFYVTQTDGSPHPPCLYPSMNPWALAPVAVLGTAKDLTLFYEEMRNQAEARNTKIEKDDTEVIEGTEGFVFYVQDGAGLWHLLKCKPSSVEDIHWVGDILPLSRITPTAWNGLESCPGGVLTVTYLRELLLEEFSLTMVNASQVRIEKAVNLVNGQIAWRDRVKTAYLETGLDMAKDGKAPVMRALSKSFKPQEMKVVYTALKQMGFIPLW
ncbi:MAG: hypothetical protein WC824_08105 [Bacteroidota bacterium]|jgi:hypothetical protein